MERLGDPLAWSKHLPPRELWKFTPGVDERLTMPVNDRGLVVPDLLVKAVKSTIDPSYRWDLLGPQDIHHFYFDKVDYPYQPDESLSLAAFRELSSNKVLMPRIFHSVLHIVMDKPPIPPRESRYYRKEAQRVAMALMGSAGISNRMMRVEKYDENELESIRSRQLEHFLFHLEAVRAIPEEFQVITPPENTPKTIEDMYTLRKCLGRAAINIVNLIELPDVEPLAA